MSEFALLYRGVNIPESAELRQQHLAKWVEWFKELGDRGHMVNPGHPLEGSGKVVLGRTKIVSDGPFAEAKDVVGGFTIVDAADISHATILAAGCPVLDVGGSVEVRRIQKINL